MSKRTSTAFTLVELLAVVTIIVVLLALLAPALDKAVRQAEMTVCSANKHGLTVGVTSYAMDNKRRYPYRQHPDTAKSWPWLIANGNGGATDDRPKYRKYMMLNGVFNCPQLPKIDIDGSTATNTFVDTNLWHGFQLRNGTTRSRGMMRIGDKLTWDWTEGANKKQITSTILAGSHYTVNTGTGGLNTTHQGTPTEAYSTTRYQDDPNTGYTLCLYRGVLASAKTSDQTVAFADLSVRKYNEVDWNTDDRMVHVPAWTNGEEWTSPTAGGTYEVIPKEY